MFGELIVFTIFKGKDFLEIYYTFENDYENLKNR